MDPVTIAALSEIAKNFTQKTSENIKKGFSDLKSIADNQTLTELAQALNVASIASPALKTMFSEINSDTMLNRTEAMKSLIELAKSPETAELLDHISGFFNWLLSKAPEIIKFLEDLFKILNDIINAIEMSWNTIATRWNTPTPTGESQFNLDIAKLLGGFWMNKDEKEGEGS